MPASTHLRWPLVSTALLLAPMLTGCFTPGLPIEELTTSTTGDGDPGDGDPGDGDPGDGDGDPGDGDGDPDTTAPQPPGSNVDLLIVIDNSGSMGSAQSKLVTSVGTLVAALDDAGADYRIAVTTSDNGNPWCPSGSTTPEAGKFVLSSCKDRIDDFVFNNGQVDASDIACNDICTLDNAALEIQPTPTHVDPNPSARPWVENIQGQTNLPESTDLSEALRCFLPMGINGCGFESQLESMYLGLVRAQNEAEENYGFIRNDSVLAVLLVSDEADCSYNQSYSEIFEQDGNQVFWSDPNSTFPSSAVCWNAGVSCSGDPNNYDSCDAVNKDVNGNEGAADSDAVLHPLGRYQGLLQDLEDQVQQLDPEREVVVGLIGGVDQNGQPFYADVTLTDPGFQSAFGIGPGCQASNPIDPNEPFQAVPPVRMYELVGAFTPGASFSICSDDMSAGLASFAAQITDQLP